jgi:hypothetical protein
MLLILALLLWPLDIALRRVSIGRRELADARRWVGGGWRRPGVAAPPVRPAEVAGMLAARDRAAGSSARAAILRPESTAGPAHPAADKATPSNRPSGEAQPAVARERATPGPAPAAYPETSTSTAPGDTLARLREAKARARGK